MYITIDGFNKGIEATNVASGAQLALDLMFSGYSVRINGLRVAIFHGPGYDMAIWAEGDYKDEAVTTI